MLSASVTSVLVNSLPSAVIAAVGCGATGKLPELIRVRTQAAILSFSVIAGVWLLGGRPIFPPAEMLQAFLWIALLLATFLWVRPMSLGLRYFMRAAFVMVTGALLFWHANLHGYVYTRNLVAFFCLGLGVWSIVERIVVVVGLPTIVGLPAVSALSLTAFLLKHGNTPMAGVSGAVAGMLTALTVMAFLVPKRLSAPALLPFCSILVIALMAATHFLFNYNPWTVITLCLPFAGLWLRELLPIPKQPALEFGILATLTVLPMAYLFGIFSI